jgi:peptidoglycan/LPS O-acetylase OafA/YrhL
LPSPDEDNLPRPTSIAAKEFTLKSEYELPRMIPQLDRLRGLAILMVLLIHAEAAAPSALIGMVNQGWAGVDLFFVLSGFLITGILWDTRDHAGYFKRFYGRRILRIWPPYTIVLVAAFCLLPLLKHSFGGWFREIPQEPLGVWAYLLMIQNFFGSALRKSPILVVTWSLAIEEQFYLIWPIVIRQGLRRMLLPCVSAGLVLAPLLRTWAMQRGISQIAIYTSPLTHGDGLLCGAAIALWLRSAKPKRGTVLALGVFLLVVGLALFFPLRPFRVTSQYCSPLVFTAVAMASSGLLLVALVSENTGRLLHRFFFMNQWLAFLGFISYGLYLYHILIFRLGVSERLMTKLDAWHHPRLTYAIMVSCAFGLSMTIAWISRVTMERAALSKAVLFA